MDRRTAAEEEGARPSGVPPSSQAAQPRIHVRAHRDSGGDGRPVGAVGLGRSAAGPEQEGCAGAGRPAVRGGHPGHREVQRGEGVGRGTAEGGRQPPRGGRPQAGGAQRAAAAARFGGHGAVPQRGPGPFLQLLLSADPDAYLDKASGLDRLSARQSDTLKRFLSQQRALQQQRTQAAEKLDSLQDTRKELGSKKKEIQGKLAEAQRLLNTLTAEERAERTAEEERANRASERVELGNEASASGRTAAAFDAAKSRVGMPYVWAPPGRGPSTAPV